MATREEAENALYDAVVAAAGSATEKKDVNLLKTASEAFSGIAHGAQGGMKRSEESYRGETDYRYTSSNHQSTDYHETQHQGENLKRPPTGFGERPVENQLLPMEREDRG